MNIRLEKVENGTTRSAGLLRQLYRSYAKEISKYTMENIEGEVVFAPGYHYRIIFADDISVGFIAHSSYPMALCKEDMHIRALYIMPDYRRRGIGEAAVLSLLWDKHVDGDVSLIMPERNATAKLFWDNFFSSWGYTERTQALNIRAADKDFFDTVLLYYTKGS